MAVAPRDLLNHAEAILGDDELSIRAAINRGYYSTYHAAKIFHDNLPTPGVLPVIPMGVHATLYAQLLNPSLSKSHASYLVSRQIAYKAKDLKRLREKGDYHLGDSVTKDEARYLIALAHGTLQLACL